MESAPSPRYPDGDRNRVTRKRQALTLIELLVAMGIAALLAAVVFSVYTAALNTLDSQSRWRAGAYPVASALDALASDLAGAAIPWGATNPPFVLESGREDAGGIRLHFFTASPLNAAQSRELFRSEQASSAYAIREMGYHLAVSNAAGTNATSRTWRTFRIDYPEGALSNRDMWPNVYAVSLEVYDGNLWTNKWGEGTNNTTLPQAARITLAIGNETIARRSAEILIPAGRRIAAPKSKN